MRCQNCKDDSPEGSQFCQHCGANLDQMTNGNPTLAHDYNQRSSKKRWIIPVLVVIAVALAISGAIVINLVFDSNSPPATTGDSEIDVVNYDYFYMESENKIVYSVRVTNLGDAPGTATLTCSRTLHTTDESFSNSEDVTLYPSETKDYQIEIIVPLYFWDELLEDGSSGMVTITNEHTFEA